MQRDRNDAASITDAEEKALREVARVMIEQAGILGEWSNVGRGLELGADGLLENRRVRPRRRPPRRPWPVLKGAAVLALEGADLEACRRVAQWGVLESVRDFACGSEAGNLIRRTFPSLLERAELVGRLGDPGDPYWSGEHRCSLSPEQVVLLAEVAKEMEGWYRPLVNDDLEEPELHAFYAGRLARAERVLRFLHEGE